ncbi:MAG: hypothetical protein WA211_10115 [Candidatus Acidiferrales bacterium]
MSEKQIHITVTPQQAKALITAVKLTQQVLAQPPNTAIYPNLGDFQLERDLVRAEINAAHDTLMKQMLEQMPEE